LRRRIELVPRLTAANAPGDAVTVLPPATVRFSEPGVTDASDGSAGSGTSLVTEPWVPEVGFTRRFVWRSPTTTPELSPIESARMLWAVWTFTPLDSSIATPPDRNGPVPVPSAPRSPPLTVSGEL
jgi:hypothetical protein